MIVLLLVLVALGSFGAGVWYRGVWDLRSWATSDAIDAAAGGGGLARRGPVDLGEQRRREIETIGRSRAVRNDGLARSLADLPWHRFDYDPPTYTWTCTLPPPSGWAGRPPDYCGGCGVTVTDAEVVASDLRPPGGHMSDMYLNLVVLLRDGAKSKGGTNG